MLKCYQKIHKAVKLFPYMASSEEEVVKSYRNKKKRQYLTMRDAKETHYKEEEFIEGIDIMDFNERGDEFLYK